MHRYRTHTCGALREADIGKEVRLSGWCHRIRDHGGVLFIDLRDHYGLTQVVADPDSPAFKVAETLRAEWVVRIDGKVRRRPGETENPDLPTNTMAAAERWAGGLSGAAYAIDDETAIKVVDGTVEVVSEGNWKLFSPKS